MFGTSNRKAALIGTSILTAVWMMQPWVAHSEDIIFSASPAMSGESCIIELLQDGTFGTSTNLRLLDSRRFGGIGAEILVTSRKRSTGAAPGPRFRITLEPPTAFTAAPAGGDDNVDWRTWFSGTNVSNGINFNRRNGVNGRRLPRAGTSITQVTGHLRARKPNGQTFPAGNYSAEAIFRCE